MARQYAIVWLDEVAARLQRELDGGAAQRAERLTVRELLGYFGYERRGQWIVGEIRRQLDARRLFTSPDFEFEYIDSAISIGLDVDAEASASDGHFADPTVRVGILPAAHHAPVTVAPDDPLEKATTLMQMEDYSQLPVMNGPRTVKGIVSWRSIGRAFAHGKAPSTVRDCVVEAHVVDTTLPLSDATDAIHKHEFVLVRDETKEITGIVTAADLAHEFKGLAHPFLLIGEIEHHLRNLVRGKFTVDELREASGGDEDISGPEGLTFGGYCRLLERPDAWKKLGLRIDRAEFIKRLDLVRKIRNEVMHFSPEPRDPLEVGRLVGMTRFFRELAPLNGA